MTREEARKAAEVMKAYAVASIKRLLQAGMEA